MTFNIKLQRKQDCGAKVEEFKNFRGLREHSDLPFGVEVSQVAEGRMTHSWISVLSSCQRKPCRESVQQLFGHLVSTPGQAPAASAAYDTRVAGDGKPLAKGESGTPSHNWAHLSEALTALLTTAMAGRSPPPGAGTCNCRYLRLGHSRP